MDDRKPIPEFTRQELDAARARNKLRKRRGTDEEYMAHLANEYQAFGLLRSRANLLSN